MDDAGRYTAEHTVMDANLEIGKLKHLLEVAEDKIRELEKQLAEKDNTSIINYGLDEDLLALDIGKSVKEQPELKSVMSEKYNKFGEDA
tara:strand:+ start:120 stop:386 length:267 start_codon:yes stop_codon:yes gene_type:complete